MRDLGKFLGFASQRPEKEIRQAAGESLGVDGLSPTSPAHAGQFIAAGAGCAASPRRQAAARANAQISRLTAPSRRWRPAQ
jgi:hypothetical protein